MPRVKKTEKINPLSGRSQQKIENGEIVAVVSHVLIWRDMSRENKVAMTRGRYTVDRERRRQ